MSLDYDMLGFDFPQELLDTFFEQEALYLVHFDQIDQLVELQKIYGLTAKRAAELVDTACRAYLVVPLEQALSAAKAQMPFEVIAAIKRMYRYEALIAGPVLADGAYFTRNDVEQMATLYQDELRFGRDAEIKAYEAKYGDLTARLSKIADLVPDFNELYARPQGRLYTKEKEEPLMPQKQK